MDWAVMFTAFIGMATTALGLWSKYRMAELELRAKDQQHRIEVGDRKDAELDARLINCEKDRARLGALVDKLEAAAAIIHEEAVRAAKQVKTVARETAVEVREIAIEVKKELEAKP